MPAVLPHAACGSLGVTMNWLLVVAFENIEPIFSRQPAATFGLAIIATLLLLVVYPDPLREAQTASLSLIAVFCIAGKNAAVGIVERPIGPLIEPVVGTCGIE
ncbi:hypothetical protein WT97_17925 [Burkholderia sp. MSMB1459WGS]|nr:hypothetical protein WT24_08375 [Burkholderia sp. MSMB1078WGS]KWO43610.1 hypothetical protein WT97_17925 [Burkholderia sp. MSMB1459WGS]